LGAGMSGLQPTNSFRLSKLSSAGSAMKADYALYAEAASGRRSPGLHPKN